MGAVAALRESLPDGVDDGAAAGAVPRLRARGGTVARCSIRSTGKAGPLASVFAVEAEGGEAFEQVIAQERHAQEILGGPIVVRPARLGHRFRPFLGREAAATDPGEGHELDLFVLVEPVDEGRELLFDRVVRQVLEDLAHVLVDRVRARILLDRCGLGIELASLEDDPTDLVAVDRRHRRFPHRLPRQSATPRRARPPCPKSRTAVAVRGIPRAVG